MTRQYGPTIVAVSSGGLPSGIAVIRVSGTQASSMIEAVAGKIPPPRYAQLSWLRDPISGEPIDLGLAMWFPGPKSVTGEDVAEFHVHGGRAIVARMLDVLCRFDGARAAEAGEFTRRAFANCRIDLTQAEGLADLLAAETETQRQSALQLAQGGVGALVATWQRSLLATSATIEAMIEFSDEDDVDPSALDAALSALAGMLSEVTSHLAEPPLERLRDGIRIVLAGPANTGKSSLFNALVGRDAAIVSPIAGTTRDRIEAPIAIEGVPMVLIDTAGMRDHTEDDIEAIGIARSHEAVDHADVVLWLGDRDAMPAVPASILVASKADLGPPLLDQDAIAVSAMTGDGIDHLKQSLVRLARDLLPRPGAIALNARHRAILVRVEGLVGAALQASDVLIIAEELRAARAELDRLTGKSGVEDMLDALFSSFCIGK